MRSIDSKVSKGNLTSRLIKNKMVTFPPKMSDERQKKQMKRGQRKQDSNWIKVL